MWFIPVLFVAALGLAALSEAVAVPDRTAATPGAADVPDAHVCAGRLPDAAALNSKQTRSFPTERRLTELAVGVEPVAAPAARWVAVSALRSVENAASHSGRNRPLRL